jgi:lipid A 3-O-deacylase
MRCPFPLLLAIPIAAHAQTPGLVSIGAGATDVLGNATRTAVDLRLEYRSGLSLTPFTEPLLAVRPWAGIEGTSRGAVWGGAGLLLDIPVDRFSFVPQAGVGGYDQGHGTALGSVLEFRVGAELAYRFTAGSRLAVAFTHTSNAGVARHNPGTEGVVVNYQFPLSRFLGP